MAASEGFVTVSFQIPAQAYEKLVKEADDLHMKKTEFLTRMLVMYFLSKDMGMAKDIFDYFFQKK